MTYITSQATKSATNSPILFHINFEISIDAEIITAIPHPKLSSKYKESFTNSCFYLYKSFRLKEIRGEIYFHFSKKRVANALVGIRVGKEIYVKFLG